MNQPELFANYELDDSSWKKTIYSLVAGSFVLNLIIALSLVYVPAVRDAFYIAALFSDVPTGWVDKDYNKTQIDAATVIKLPPADQLQYPDGYFEFLNSDAPSLDAFTAQNMQPEIVSTDSGFPLDFNNPLPTPTPVPPPVLTPLPSSNGSVLPPLPKRRKGKLGDFQAINKTPVGTPQPSPTVQAEPKKDDAAKNQTPQIPDEKDGVNQRPLKNLGKKAAQLIKEKKLDLTKPVDVVVTGQLDKDGKLTNPKRDANSTGDPLAQEMVTELIAAMSDSGMLKFVSALSEGTAKRDVSFRIARDENKVTIQLSSTVGTEIEARTKVSNLNTLFSFYKQMRKGTEEGDLLEKVVLDSDKGQVLINWEMPAAEMMDKVQKKLADLEKTQQPQSTAQSNNTNAQAAK